MSLSIPERAKEPLAKLLAMTPETRARLVSSVRSVRPKLTISEWVSAVAANFASERGDVEAIVSTLVTLYGVRAQDPGLSAADLAADVQMAAERSGDSRLARPDDWKAAVPVLADLLSADDTLGVTAKAFSVMTGFERNFVGAHLFTDLRPVFGKDITPAAAVVVHNLMVTYEQDGDTFEIAFGLGSHDLRTLSAVLERAIKKEDALRKFMEPTKLPIFEEPQ